ncbi:DUF3667 domain-containing protein [Lacinutrix neustonica]|uniref:DUF3667 domain-containing protein n=1 Tax=Lacinutrix neustonica TaxID=2980107 RepID=A0A9E8SDL6_9FLAO|nr:DUF3667 domain-containing protein [Lacinutrix neustonica]WAC02568.1 DUF3667 domain-containing protein [Lacinutrix neustonica]
MSISYSTCKNCEKQFQSRYDFCPYCGQKDREELTLSLLFSNTISNYFSVDARFFKSFLPLLFRPGYLAEKFIGGKRLLYLHPAQLYLFISVVFFFLFSFSTRKQIDSVNSRFDNFFSPTQVTNSSVSGKGTTDSTTLEVLNTNKEKDSIAKTELRKVLNDNVFLTGLTQKQVDSLIETEKFKNNSVLSSSFNESKIDSLIAAKASDHEIYSAMGLKETDGAFKRRLYTQGLKFYKSKQGGSILQTFYDTIPIAMFFLLPIFALILKLLYYNRGRYAHHLVFSFYYFAFLFSVFTIILTLNFIMEIPNWVVLVITLSTFSYLLIAIKHFYRQGLFLSFIKSGLTAFLFLALVIPITVIFLGLFSFMFY